MSVRSKLKYSGIPKKMSGSCVMLLNMKAKYIIGLVLKVNRIVSLLHLLRQPWGTNES